MSADNRLKTSPKGPAIDRMRASHIGTSTWCFAIRDAQNSRFESVHRVTTQITAVIINPTIIAAQVLILICFP